MGRKRQRTTAVQDEGGTATAGGTATEVDTAAEALRRRWGVRRTYTDADSWRTAQSLLSTHGVALRNRDVPHTGCCKGYSLATVLVPELGELEVARVPTRAVMDLHVRRYRRAVAADLAMDEWQKLRSPANTNHADWTVATSLDDARLRVGLSYDAARAVGHSMSPVWLEEWETSRIAKHESVVVLELHDACASNRSRSHFQVVMPSPEHVITSSDQLVVLKRMQCHYNPVSDRLSGSSSTSLVYSTTALCTSPAAELCTIVFETPLLLLLFRSGSTDSPAPGCKIYPPHFWISSGSS